MVTSYKPEQFSTRKEETEETYNRIQDTTEQNRKKRKEKKRKKKKEENPIAGYFRVAIVFSNLVLKAFRSV